MMIQSSSFIHSAEQGAMFALGVGPLLAATLFFSTRNPNEHSKFASAALISTGGVVVAPLIGAMIALVSKALLLLRS